MTATANYLAFDLGASSGRAMLGRFDGQRLTLEELHRFDNRPVVLQGRLYWNAFGLFEELKKGLGLATQRGIKLDGVGIDTWGVDFGLLGRGGELLDMPRHYRDARNRGMMERAFERVPRAEIYARTGIQFMPFNTLFQLLAVASSPTRWLDLADRLLMMPDLLTHWLTGVAEAERSIASTSQMMNARTGMWDAELLARLDLPAKILPPIRDTGTLAGPLLKEIADEVGQAGTPVIRTAAHDTAAAVAAVPAVASAPRGRRAEGEAPAEPNVAAGLRTGRGSGKGIPQIGVREGILAPAAEPFRDPSLAGRGVTTAPNWAYISSGTWSLVGVELSAPLITLEVLAANFTNEAGVAGTIRFLRNVPGLWLVQECQRTWAARGQTYSHAQLAKLAAAAPSLRSLVEPDDARFIEPGDMPARIQAACAAHGQPAPDSPGEIVRCALDSLAMKYRLVIATLERLIGRPIEILHLVGGGVRNELLNQLAASATGKPVVAGPIEATAAGNVLVQAMAQGRIGSLPELRQVVAASTNLKRYEPVDTAAWAAASAGPGQSS